jgi:hypothetical protein
MYNKRVKVIGGVQIHKKARLPSERLSFKSDASVQFNAPRLGQACSEIRLRGGSASPRLLSGNRRAASDRCGQV